MKYLPILLRAASLALEQSYMHDYSSAIEAVLNNIGNCSGYLATTKCNKANHAHNCRYILHHIDEQATLVLVSQGLYSLRRQCLIVIGILIMNLRRSSDHLRFIMGISIPIRQRPLSEKRPRMEICISVRQCLFNEKWPWSRYWCYGLVIIYHKTLWYAFTYPCFNHTALMYKPSIIHVYIYW